MFAYFKGEIIDKSKDNVVVLVNNIGYEIFMSEGDIARIDIGSTVSIYTYTDIKEGYIGIFGFLNKEAKSVFEKLKKVSGIGSKTALGVLSNMMPSDVCVAIASEDATILSKIPGIGNKTAQRIILELKDKILKDDVEKKIVSSTKVKTNTALNEAMLALKVLGYSATQIDDAIIQLDISNMNVEAIIKATLKQLNRK